MTKSKKGQQRDRRQYHSLNLTTPAMKDTAKVIFEDRSKLSSVLAKGLNVQFTASSADSVHFKGEQDAKQKVEDALKMLSGSIRSGIHINDELIKKIAEDVNKAAESGLTTQFNKPATNKTAGRYGFEPKTEGQAEYAQMIDDFTLSFGVGPAGTGKTHIAVVKALQAFKKGDVKKILIARPLVEAGEKIGFLPGTAEDKLAPMMRPIYDEIDNVFGLNAHKKLMEMGKIEIVPIGFMRGRTFKDSFIILDEAQNTTKMQMKMALTRIGEGSKMVVTGDPGQNDLPAGVESGLTWATERLKNNKSVGIMPLSPVDIVRSEIVQSITPDLEDDEQPVPSQKVVNFPKP
ncbi:MAG: PhoH family protein [Alphaproteobacteria bacterium]|nr:PhoH family protein [Alphaproteobacteria bacterium]